MKERIGRSTTHWIDALIRIPMTTTDTAVRVSAHQRFRDVSSSVRTVENFTATVPATLPSSVIGAITSQYRSAPRVTGRKMMPPPRASA